MLQKGQACAVNVHGDGHRVGLAHGLQLLKHGVPVPRLHRGYAAAADVPDGAESAVHDAGVDTVAGAGQNAGLAAGGHQQVVIGGIVVLVAIVHLHGAHGGGQHRQAQLQTEKVKGRVGRAIFADGVHLHADFLPLLIVALEGHAQSFGAGAGDGVAAGHAVAHGAGLAVGTHTGAGCL